MTGGTNEAAEAMTESKPFCEPDDKRLTFRAFDKMNTASGICNVMRNRWWSVHPERGVIFFKQSPQCNQNEDIARRLQVRLYPWAECRFIECVIIPVDPRDYVS